MPICAGNSIGKLQPASLKAWQLKYWAFLVGLPTTGTKTVLHDILTKSLEEDISTPCDGRVVSVDMGIRNLAYCVAQPALSSSGAARGSITIKAWRRTDLLREDNEPESDTEDTSGAMRPSELSARGKKCTSKVSKARVANDNFTPASLSKTAYKVSQELLAHRPTHILIERQRFRSGGAAAIQEWTVRVNMLESMLWACFEALQHSGTASEAGFPDIHAINPARVAHFWSSAASRLSQPHVLLAENDGNAQRSIMDAMLVPKKIEKKDKVNIVRSWCNGEASSGLIFEGDAAGVAEAFTLDPRQSKGVRELAGGKLDDLADCLLQAAAFTRWRRNRVALAKKMYREE